MGFVEQVILKNYKPNFLIEDRKLFTKWKTEMHAKSIAVKFLVQFVCWWPEYAASVECDVKCEHSAVSFLFAEVVGNTALKSGHWLIIFVFF